MNVHILPHVNAVLNASVTVLLIAGFIFIRRGQVSRHKTAMLSAFVLSVLFLLSYLIYHSEAGATRFAGGGWIRPIYFTVLISHTVLAAVIVPLALVTLTRALRGQYDRHRRVARWTLPMWIYVGFTGSAVIYVLLYHLFPAR